MHLKGTVPRDEFVFGWHVWLVLGLNRGWGHFSNFLEASMILKRKSVFLAVNASLRWPDIVSCLFLSFLLITNGV
jgi:hypothetical protein